MKLIWDDLLPHVTHDVRALVRKSLSNAQLLEKSLGPTAAPEISAQISAIIKSQLDLNRLFVRLTALADAQAVVYDSSRPHDQTVTIEMAIISVKLECSDAIQQAAAEFLVTQPLPIFEVPQKIPLALRELIENSLHYRDPSRPLQIGVAVEEGAGTARIRVTDNGSGIDHSYASDLFKPFQRLDARRSGFGLGLAIAKAIVESTGGVIYCEPNEIGASFVIELAIGGN